MHKPEAGHLPAFPIGGYSDHPDRQGLSIRDYIAIQAMHAIISNPSYDGTREEYVSSAYRYADAMLKARYGA